MPDMVDSEFGLPVEKAERLRKMFIDFGEKTKFLAEENMNIQTLINDLRNNVLILDNRISEVETKTTLITTDGSVGSPSLPVVDVVTYNVTLVSKRARKKNITTLSNEEKSSVLPEPIKYELDDGRILVGFIEDEMPQYIRSEGGYSLSGLVAILTAKLIQLERRIEQLERSGNI